MYRGSDLEDFSAGDKLLGDNACDGKHGKAAIVDLLGLDGLEGCWGSWLEAEGVELQVAVDIAVLEAGDSNR